MKIKSVLTLFALILVCIDSLNAAPHIKRYTAPYEKVAPGKLEWVVYMAHKDSLFSGALISNKHILTSAHALYKQDTNCFEAIFKNAKEQSSIKVKRFITHPKYDETKPLGHDYDFAIAELEESVNVKYEAITLPKIDTETYTFGELVNIYPIYAAGYATKETLRKVQLNWSQVYESSAIPNIYHFYYSGDGEHGDSGGPLFYEVNHEYYILGIADSVSERDKEVNFQPISIYLPFILNHTSLEFSGIETSDSSANWKSVHCYYEVDVDTGLGIAVASAAVLFIGIVSTCLIWRKVKTKFLTD